MGIFSDATYDDVTVQLAPGDRFVVYSDGVSEAQDQHDTFFDVDGIHDTVTRHSRDTAVELAGHICDAAERHERPNQDCTRDARAGSGGH